MHRFTEPTPVPTIADIISVFVEKWEIECCGIPSAVGYDATWSLTFIESASGRGGPLPAGAGWSTQTHLITASGIEAYWPNPDDVHVGVVHGYFSGTRHGATVPDGIYPTTGLVIDLQLQTVEYQQTAGVRRPIPDTRLLRRIPESSKWFADNLDTTHCIEAGFLMDLAVIYP
ncbi:hypothetical protein EEB14_17395 [Rhodococcus sp. WS4]|nr:hypothetical protein EEB14_17395 [Rhodococcus sp. WS4]